jgi:hypothetical protein
MTLTQDEFCEVIMVALVAGLETQGAQYALRVREITLTDNDLSKPQKDFILAALASALSAEHDPEEN